MLRRYTGRDKGPSPYNGSVQHVKAGILGVRSTTTPPFMAFFSFKCTSSTCFLFLNAISFLCLHVYLRIVLDDFLWVWEINF